MILTYECLWWLILLELSVYSFLRLDPSQDGTAWCWHGGAYFFLSDIGSLLQCPAMLIFITTKTGDTLQNSEHGYLRVLPWCNTSKILAAGTTGTGGTIKRSECGWHAHQAWSQCTKQTRRSEAPTTSSTPTTGGKWPRSFTWSMTSWKIGQHCLRHFITTPTCLQHRLTSINFRHWFISRITTFSFFIEVLG